MNITDLKINGTNSVQLTDSLKAPLFSIKISLNSNSISPSDNNLSIFVAKNETSIDELKTFTFPLIKSLGFYNDVSDEFILKPIFDGNKMTMKAFVIRKVSEDSILAQEVLEELTYQPITLFEGTNYIYTNYENATINIVYPKNTDLVNYFLNNAVYNERENKPLTWDDLYFKDIFTEANEEINIEANNLNINCLTSKNNKFSLDSDGNLIVNSITTNTSSSTSIDFDSIYPVGSIYLSMNATNPSTLFGGVWEQITGFYLYAGSTAGTGGSNVSGASTGNTGSTALSTSNLPSHNHSIPALSGTTSNAGNHSHNLPWGYQTIYQNGGNTRPDVRHTGNVTATSSNGAHTHTVTTNASTTNNTGNGTGHTHTLNNHTHTITPPYINIFTFKRIS